MSKYLKSVTDRYQPRCELERKFCRRIADAMNRGDQKRAAELRETLSSLQKERPMALTSREARRIKRSAPKPKYVAMSMSEGIAHDSEGKMITSSTVKGAYNAAVTRAVNIFGRGKSSDNR